MRMISSSEFSSSAVGGHGPPPIRGKCERFQMVSFAKDMDNMKNNEDRDEAEVLTDNIIKVIVPKMQSFYDMVLKNPEFLQQNGESLSHFNNTEVFAMCHAFKTLMDANHDMTNYIKGFHGDS